jgi:hypothetical protein
VGWCRLGTVGLRFRVDPGEALGSADNRAPARDRWHLMQARIGILKGRNRCDSDRSLLSQKPPIPDIYLFTVTMVATGLSV